MTRSLWSPLPLLLLAFGLLCSSCGDESSTDSDGGSDAGGPADSGVPDGGTATSLYHFDSRFEPGRDSVAYPGQITRQVLLRELDHYLESLDDQSFSAPTPGDVVSALEFFYDFPNAGGTADYELQSFSEMTLAQANIGEIGTLKGLKEKMPDHDGNFGRTVVGYGDGSFTPEQVLFDMFGKLEGLVIDRFNGNIPTDPDGASIQLVTLSGDGIEYAELIAKYLAGAVAFSQAADDYLDDDVPGKGLLADNTARAEEDGEVEPFTELEHGWDEGFGYFGAARDYLDYSDDELAGAGGRADWQGWHDTNADGRLDLSSELNFSHAQYAARRDRDSVAPTDFTRGVFEAFRQGRALISGTPRELSPTELDSLRALRNRALDNWENAMAASVVHYLNGVIQDMDAFGTADYVYSQHAKHWSEMKGFALILQFNVNHSPWSPSAFAELHAKIGNRPVLPGAEAQQISDYRTALLSARALIGTTYGFDSANLGDDSGEGGW